jgi:hypothetical protein
MKEINMEDLSMQELFLLESEAESDYRAAVSAHWSAWKSGVEIGCAEIDRTKSRLLDIRDFIEEAQGSEQASAYDAKVLSQLMLDDA